MMKRNSRRSHQVVACTLLISLFLQSCGNSFNSVIPTQLQEVPSEHTLTLTEQIQPLLNQELTAAGGHLVTFYKYKDQLKASIEVIDEKGKCYNDIPVAMEEGTDLASLTCLPKKIQQSRIEVQFDELGKPRGLVLHKPWIMGGKDTEDEGEDEDKTVNKNRKRRLRRKANNAKGKAERQVQQQREREEKERALEEEKINRELRLTDVSWWFADRPEDQQISHKLNERINRLAEAIEDYTVIGGNYSIGEVLYSQEQFYLSRLLTLQAKRPGLLDQLIHYLDPTHYQYNPALVAQARDQLLRDVFYFLIYCPSIQFSIYRYAHWNKNKHFHIHSDPLKIAVPIKLNERYCLQAGISLQDRKLYKEHLEANIRTLSYFHPSSSEVIKQLFNPALNIYYLGPGLQATGRLGDEARQSHNALLYQMAENFSNPTLSQCFNLVRSLLPNHPLWPAWEHPQIGSINGLINRVELLPHAANLLNIISQLAQPTNEKKRKAIREKLSAIQNSLKQKHIARRIERLLSLVYQPVEDVTNINDAKRLTDEQFEEIRRKLLLLTSAPTLFIGLIPTALFLKKPKCDEFDPFYTVVPWVNLRNFGLLIHDSRNQPYYENIVRQALPDLIPDMKIVRHRLRQLLYREMQRVVGKEPGAFDLSLPENQEPLNHLTILANFGGDLAHLQELRSILTQERLEKLQQSSSSELLRGSFLRLSMIVGEASANLSETIKDYLVPEQESSFWSNIKGLRHAGGHKHLKFLFEKDGDSLKELLEPIFASLISLGRRIDNFFIKAPLPFTSWEEVQNFYKQPLPKKDGNFGEELDVFLKQVGQVQDQRFQRAGSEKGTSNPGTMVFDVSTTLEEEEIKRLQALPHDPAFFTKVIDKIKQVLEYKIGDSIPRGLEKDVDIQSFRNLSRILPAGLDVGLGEICNMLKEINSLEDGLLAGSRLLEEKEESQDNSLLAGSLFIGEEEESWENSPFAGTFSSEEQDENQEYLFTGPLSLEEQQERIQSQMMEKVKQLREDLGQDFINKLNLCTYENLAKTLCSEIRITNNKNKNIKIKNNLELCLKYLPIDENVKIIWREAYLKLKIPNPLQIVYEELENAVELLDSFSSILEKVSSLANFSIENFSLQSIASFCNNDALCYNSEFLLIKLRDSLKGVTRIFPYIEHLIPYEDQPLILKLELLRRSNNGLAHLGAVTRFSTMTENGRRAQLYHMLRELLIDLQDSGNTSMLKIFVETKEAIKEMLKNEDALKRGFAANQQTQNSSLEGNFGGRVMQFHEREIAGDGDCGFTALGLTRVGAVSQLLNLSTRKDADKIRRLVAEDIFAALIERPLPYLWQFGAFELVDEYHRATSSLSQLLRELNDHYEAHTGQRLNEEGMLTHLRKKKKKEKQKKLIQSYEEALDAVRSSRDRLRSFTMREDVYQEFIVREFLIGGSWITYLRNQERQEGAGVMAALAHLNNLEIVVWVKNSKTGELEIAHHAGDGIRHGHIRHLYHRDSLTHFNRLVTDEEDEAEPETERTNPPIQGQAWAEVTYEFNAERPTGAGIRLSPYSTHDVRLEPIEKGFQVVYQGQRGVVIFDDPVVDFVSGRVQAGAHLLKSHQSLVIIQRSGSFIFFFTS